MERLPILQERLEPQDHLRLNLTMPTIHERAQSFFDLHAKGMLLLPNAWDVGSARMFAGMGMKAIATTSAGFAFSQGTRDWVGVTPRDQAFQHCRAMVESVDVPVSADLEDGFGAEPEAVAETVREAAEIGLAGCTIEDTTGQIENPIHGFDLAVERISAAVEAKRSLDRPFVLTARAENFLHDRPDLDDTVRRLRAFEEAGADVLYAPGLPDLQSISLVCAALTKPVNVVLGIRPRDLSVQDLVDAGVRRISFGSALARRAYGSAISSIQEALESGGFRETERAISFAEIESYIAKGTP